MRMCRSSSAVPGAGVEPARLAAAAFKAAVSAFPPPGRVAPARRHARCNVTVAGLRRPGVPRRAGHIRVDAVSSAAPTAPDAAPEQAFRLADQVDRRPRATRLLAAVRRHRADLLAALVFAVLAGWLTHGLWPDPAGRMLALNPEDQALYEWFLAVDARALLGDFDLLTDRLNAPDGVNLMANTTVIALGVALRAGHPAAGRAGHLRAARRRQPRRHRRRLVPAVPPDAARPPARRRARRRAVRVRARHGLADQQPPAHDRPVAGAGDRLAGGPAAAGRRPGARDPRRDRPDPTRRAGPSAAAHLRGRAGRRGHRAGLHRRGGALPRRGHAAGDGDQLRRGGPGPGPAGAARLRRRAGDRRRARPAGARLPAVVPVRRAAGRRRRHVHARPTSPPT